MSWFLYFTFFWGKVLGVSLAQGTGTSLFKWWCDSTQGAQTLKLHSLDSSPSCVTPSVT